MSARAPALSPLIDYLGLTKLQDQHQSYRETFVIQRDICNTEETFVIQRDLCNNTEDTFVIQRDLRNTEFSTFNIYQD